ncbi:hypothetical protein TNCV_1866831 [Trichonephila clavipes]|nr:hypothetical protein TNCV_1866831 [Trichonephila clavipes]
MTQLGFQRGHSKVKNRAPGVDVTGDLARHHPNFGGEYPGGGQEPPSPSTDPTRGLGARRLFRVTPPTHRHYIFTNIHAFSGIQTKVLQHSPVPT